MIFLCQCWDDGVVDDIRLCDILRAYSAKASFNLNPGLHGPHRSQPWRYKETKDVVRLGRGELAAVYEGFTIANHTVSHPRPLQVTPDAWRAEVFDGRKMLQDLFGQSVHGFAYPYGDHDAGTAAIVAEAGHAYARTCANSTPSWPTADRFIQPTDCHFLAPDFWEKYARAKAASAAAFYFWGHSYELLGEADWREFDAKIARLSADPDANWIDLPELARLERP